MNGVPSGPTIDLLCAKIPDEVAKRIEKETGISAIGDEVCFRAIELQNGKWMTRVGGSGISIKGSGEIPALGIKPWKHDYEVKYTSLVESISNDELYAYGYFEYHDKQNKKRCYLLCELRGKVTRVPEEMPQLSGNGRWIGPLANVKFPEVEVNLEVEHKK